MSSGDFSRQLEECATGGRAITEGLRFPLVTLPSRTRIESNWLDPAISAEVEAVAGAADVSLRVTCLLASPRRRQSRCPGEGLSFSVVLEPTRARRATWLSVS
jgi:hypothetical protein